MTNLRKHLFGKQRWLLSLLLFSVSFEFVACGAADIQSAKAYRQRRDYVRADEMLQKALKEDPTNDEAWFLYIENLFDLKQYEKIATVIDSAMLYSTGHRSELQDYKQNTWVQLYNGGLQAYQANPENSEAQQAAIAYLESARQLAPEQPETYDLLGNIYIEGVHDTSKAVDVFKQELNSLSSQHQQGASMGLMLKMSPAAVERAIGGAPARKSTVSIGGSDSATIYVYPSKQAYVYFERAPKTHDWQLTGWRITPIETQGMQPLRLSENAYIFVANNAYQKGLAALSRHDTATASTQFETAIPLLMTLQQIDPSNDVAAQLIPDMYVRLNRTEKAKQEYAKAVAEHPTKEAYVNYGMLLMNASDYDGAVAAFQKALDMEPNYASALYDLAATYRNWAKADQDAKKAPATITGKLQKSTEYFERLHTLNKRDYDVLSQLFDSYRLLHQKDKAIGLISEMESWKNTDAANDSQYWYILGQLYAFADRAKDSEAAFKKADQLKTH